MYSCDICDTSYKKVLDIKEHISLMHPKDNHSIANYGGECQTESPNDLAYRHIMKMHRSFYKKNYRWKWSAIVDFSDAEEISPKMSAPRRWSKKP